MLFSVINIFVEKLAVIFYQNYPVLNLTTNTLLHIKLSCHLKVISLRKKSYSFSFHSSQ